MGGAIGAAFYLVNLPEVGGIEALLSNENVSGKISILPDFSDANALIALLIIPLQFNGGVPGILVQNQEEEDILLRECLQRKMKTMLLVQHSFSILCTML